MFIVKKIVPPQGQNKPHAINRNKMVPDPYGFATRGRKNLHGEKKIRIFVGAVRYQMIGIEETYKLGSRCFGQTLPLYPKNWVKQGRILNRVRLTTL